MGVLEAQEDKEDAEVQVDVEEEEEVVIHGQLLTVIILHSIILTQEEVVGDQEVLDILEVEV